MITFNRTTALAALALTTALALTACGDPGPSGSSTAASTSASPSTSAAATNGSASANQDTGTADTVQLAAGTDEECKQPTGSFVTPFTAHGWYDGDGFNDAVVVLDNCTKPVVADLRLVDYTPATNRFWTTTGTEISAHRNAVVAENGPVGGSAKKGQTVGTKVRLLLVTNGAKGTCTSALDNDDDGVIAEKDFPADCVTVATSDEVTFQRNLVQ